MKITKSELFSIINSLDDLLEDIDHKHEELAKKVYKLMLSLEKDELDIEGYEKVEWVKFNPDDIDTFPPFGHYICVCKDIEEVYVAYRSDKCTNEIFASLPYNIEYWRPIPKPHRKEVKNEA